MNAMSRNRETRRALVPLLLALALFAAGPLVARADDLKDARAALAAGQLDQALELFNRVSAQGFAEGSAGAGQVYLRKRDFGKAQEAFEKAQKMDANLAKAWFGLGEVRRRQGDCEAALPLLQKAVEIDRKYPDAQLALGDCYVQVKRYDAAIQALNPGLNWGEKWKPRFLVALGQVEMARDSLRDAGIYLTQAQQTAPDDPLTNRALGDFYLKRGIGSLAVPNYQKAVELDSADVELHYALGQALYYDQQYKEALEVFRWVTQRDPEFAPGQLAMGNLFYLWGQNDARRYADARPYLEKYTQLMPKDAKGWSLLGRDLYFVKARDEAVAALSKAVELGDKSKEMYTIYGRTLVGARKWEEAIAAFGKGDPNSNDQVSIGQMFGFLGNNKSDTTYFDRADSVYWAVVLKDSTSRDGKFALTEIAKHRFRFKDYPGSVALLQRRIALDPNSDEAYYYMGLSYKEMKQLPEAVQALRQAVVIAPTKGDRHYWLASVLAAADSAAESAEEFRRFTAIDSTSREAAIAFQQLGYRALLDKQWSRAIELLERSVAINDKDPQTLVLLAQGYANANNRAKAVEVFRKALAIQPGNTEAAKGLKALGQ